MVEDTIVAPISGPGPSAIAVLRLSGPDSYLIASQVFSPWPVPVRPLHAVYGKFAHGDDGIVLPFQAGKSFTGEETVELSIHGSRASVQGLLDACLQAGARIAKPGEFTQRAFMNGRVDLTQAEAIRETIEADTERQLRAANRAREGRTGDAVRQILKSIMSVIALVEATVDFSEEIGDLDREEAARILKEATKTLEILASRAENARLVRNGIYIAIIGPPNSGKSSLLNSILNSDRALVSSIPGTTRDFLEERVSLNGYLVTLADTAGLRDTEDPIETLGIVRSYDIAGQADMVWFLFDSSQGLSPQDEDIYNSISTKKLLLANKSDLAKPSKGLAISAKTGEGILELTDHVINEFETLGDEPSPNERQLSLLLQALSTLLESVDHLHADTPVDLISVLLNDAYSSLAEITGDQIEEDMIDRIFRDFCLGK